MLSKTAGTYHLRLHFVGHDVHQGVQHGTGLEHDVEHHGFVDDQFRRIAILFCSRRNSGGLPTALRYGPVAMQLEYRAVRASWPNHLPGPGRTSGVRV